MLRAKFSDCQQLSKKSLACSTNIQILCCLNLDFAHQAKPFLASSRTLIGLVSDGIPCLNGVHHSYKADLCNCSREIPLDISCRMRFSIEKKGLPFFLHMERDLSYQNFIPLWFKDNIKFPRLSLLDVHQCFKIVP